jgi:hypothetical protein
MGNLISTAQESELSLLSGVTTDQINMLKNLSGSGITAQQLSNLNTIASNTNIQTLLNADPTAFSSLVGNATNLNGLASNVQSINSLATNATALNSMASNSTAINNLAGSYAALANLATNYSTISSTLANTQTLSGTFVKYTDLGLSGSPGSNILANYAQKTDLGSYAQKTDLGSYVQKTDLGSYIQYTDLGFSSSNKPTPSTFGLNGIVVKGPVAVGGDIGIAGSASVFGNISVTSSIIWNNNSSTLSYTPAAGFSFNSTSGSKTVNADSINTGTVRTYYVNINSGNGYFHGADYGSGNLKWDWWSN